MKTMELNAQISAFGSQNNEAQFSKWLSKMWESFNIVEEIIRTHDPSYLAALQLLQEIKARAQIPCVRWKDLIEMTRANTG